MGLTKADAVVLALVLQNRNTVIRDVLCLGAPTTHFSYEWIEKQLFPWLKKECPANSVNLSLPFRSNPCNRNSVPFREFFAIWGLENIQVMDIDDYEGANHLFDLNERDCPRYLYSNFDLIVDGGTLEHCFNLSNALKSIGTMLRDNGVVFHSNPANLMLDHGFFQISPTLYSDYYQSAGFNLLYGGLSHTKSKLVLDVKIEKYTSDIYRSKSGSRRSSKLPRMFVLFAAEKTSDSIQPESIVQNYYKKIHSDKSSKTQTIHYKISSGNIMIRRNISTLIRSITNLFWNR